MLLESADYKKDVKAAAVIASIVWDVASARLRSVVHDAISDAIRAIVQTYRAELVAKYGDHSDGDLFESVKADVEENKR